MLTILLVSETFLLASLRIPYLVPPHTLLIHSADLYWMPVRARHCVQYTLVSHSAAFALAKEDKKQMAHVEKKYCVE